MAARSASSWREIGRQFDKALATGFRAVKMEVLFYDLVTDRELVGLIHEGRRMLGDDILMAVDFGYRWHNWHDAQMGARPARRLRHLFRRSDAAA